MLTVPSATIPAATQRRAAQRGWNVFGNLLDLGLLAFAPATPEVVEVARYLGRTYHHFDDHFLGVFRDEDSAVRP